jgi:ABC-type Fe3+-hydroxamate transport system substrate-binding protein
MPMRILVTGGRKFADKELLFTFLDRLHQERGITLIIHGAAQGADSLADEWSKARGVETLPCLADVERYKRAVWDEQCKQMLAHKPDLVVAFPGGNGTANMVQLAQKTGVEVVFASPKE